MNLGITKYFRPKPQAEYRWSNRPTVEDKQINDFSSASVLIAI